MGRRRSPIRYLADHKAPSGSVTWPGMFAVMSKLKMCWRESRPLRQPLMKRRHFVAGDELIFPAACCGSISIPVLKWCLSATFGSAWHQKLLRDLALIIDWLHQPLRFETKPISARLPRKDDPSDDFIAMVSSSRLRAARWFHQRPVSTRCSMKDDCSCRSNYEIGRGNEPLALPHRVNCSGASPVVMAERHGKFKRPLQSILNVV